MKTEVVKQIRSKGNGQALIYISIRDLKEYGLEIGGHVRLTKVKQITYVKECE